MQTEFFIPGIPATAGSKRFVGLSRAGRGILVDSAGAKGKAWRAVVAQYGHDCCQAPMPGPLRLTCRFVMPYRKGDLKKDGTPKPTAPYWHTTKPDATKMLRALEDALTAIAWHDDAQISCQQVSKTYGANPGASIRIETMSQPETPISPAKQNKTLTFITARTPCRKLPKATPS